MWLLFCCYQDRPVLTGKSCIYHSIEWVFTSLGSAEWGSTHQIPTTVGSDEWRLALDPFQILGKKPVTRNFWWKIRLCHGLHLSIVATSIFGCRVHISLQGYWFFSELHWIAFSSGNGLYSVPKIVSFSANASLISSTELNTLDFPIFTSGTRRSRTERVHDASKLPQSPTHTCGADQAQLLCLTEEVRHDVLRLVRDVDLLWCIQNQISDCELYIMVLNLAK